MQENSYLCKFIASHSDWRRRLETEPYDIRISTEENLSIFNYRMIDGPDFALPETQEARGIILDTQSLNVVCWPFRKFGNYGESYADVIDWSTARVQEKIDGSIMKLWYQNGWRLSSNSVITPKTGEDIADLASLFVEAAKAQGLDQQNLDPRNTYIFELTSPENRVVLAYDHPEIWHIGTRNCKNGKESNPDIGIQKPQEYALSSLSDCIQAADTLNQNGLRHEGFVVVDGNWNRIKIKTPEYLIAMHMNNNGNTLQDIVSMLRSKEDAEYLSYFPEQKEKFDQIDRALDRLHDKVAGYQIEMIDQYHTVFHDDRKAFAISVQEDPNKAWAFDAIDKETMDADIRAAKLINKMSDKQVAKELKKENKKINVSTINNDIAKETQLD